MSPATPLHAPVAFFGDPPDWADRVVTVLVLVVGATAGTWLAYVVVGDFAASQVSGTVFVENPDYPGEGYCETTPFEPERTGCDEPAELELTYGAAVERVFWDVAGYAPLGVFGFWLWTAVHVQVSTFLFDGEGSIVDSAAISAWATVPVALGHAVFALVAGYSVLATDASPTGQHIGEVSTGLLSVDWTQGPILALAGLWAGFVLYCGLRGQHRQPDPAAGFTAMYVGVSAVAAALLAV